MLSLREMTGDIFELFETGKYDAICITTNGEVKKNGEAVMGRGIALTAKSKFKGIERRLANRLNLHGNHVYVLGLTKHGRVLSFPTKRRWRDSSHIDLIVSSAKQLVEKADEHNMKQVLLTRPGCGNGNLNWSTVKQELVSIFDDRFIIVDNR